MEHLGLVMTAQEVCKSMTKRPNIGVVQYVGSGP